MPIDDPDVLLKDPEMSRDFLNHVLGTTPDTDPKPADAKHLEGEDVIIHGLKGRPELDEARVFRVRVMGEGARQPWCCMPAPSGNLARVRVTPRARSCENASGLHPACAGRS